MTDLVATRARYLQEAARLLAVSSPSASAFLGSARNKLIQETELDTTSKDWDVLRRDTCGACGNLLVPGWSCQVSTRQQAQRRSRRGKDGPKVSTLPATELVYTCTRCRRRTEQILQHQPRRRPASQHVISSKSETSSSRPETEGESKGLKTANTSSKQRQKARKGGLQAMLEKNKAQKSTQGLDLMDFAM